MPFMTRSAGYDPAVGAEYFNEEQDRIKQRRLELQKMLEAPPSDHGWGGVGAALIRNLSKGYWEGQTDKDERGLAERRQAFTQDWLNKMPVATPGSPEVEGTGPIAPPPGTPGVEPSGGGSTPMNTPEPGPNAPPEAFSAQQPDTPAGWVGPKGGSMIPQGVEFKANKAATPMLPANINDVAKWAAQGIPLGPAYAAIGTHAMNQAIDAPIRAEEKKMQQDAIAAQREADRIGRAEQAQLQRNQQEYMFRLNAAQQDFARAQAQGNKEDMLRFAAALRPPSDPGSMHDVGTSVRGNPVVANSKSGIRFEVVDGVPAKTPYAEVTTLKGAAGPIDGDFTKTGDAFLSTLPAEDQALIKKVAAGEIPLTNFSTKGGHREALAKQAAAYDPAFNATRSGMWREFTQGLPGKNLTNINTAIAHMGTMAELADAMKTGDVQAINKVVNFVQTQFGRPEVTNFATARQAVSEELMRTFRVVGASTSEQKAWEEKFKEAQSPEQLRGAITTAAKLLQGRIEAVDDQWKRGTGSKEGFPNAISPENEALLARFGVKRKGGAAPAAAAPAGQAAPVRITNDAEFNALPPNTKFIGPDGKVRTKP